MNVHEASTRVHKNYFAQSINVEIEINTSRSYITNEHYYGIKVRTLNHRHRRMIYRLIVHCIGTSISTQKCTCNNIVTRQITILNAHCTAVCRSRWAPRANFSNTRVMTVSSETFFFILYLPRENMMGQLFRIELFKKKHRYELYRMVLSRGIYEIRILCKYDMHPSNISM